MPAENRGGDGNGGMDFVNPMPPSAVVDDFHAMADTDLRPQSLHHTLGPNPNQSSPGNHNHRDGMSSPLLQGLSLTGSHADGTALQSVIATLVALGAVDGTSA